MVITLIIVLRTIHTIFQTLKPAQEEPVRISGLNLYREN